MKYRNVARKYGAPVLGFALATGSTFAQAAIDITAAVAGIADVATAISTVIGALMAMSLAIYGINAVYKFINRKSGA